LEIPMTRAEVLKLEHGDEVKWNDPDDDACSRFIVIRTIEVRENDIVVIHGKDGSYLECFCEELS